MTLADAMRAHTAGTWAAAFRGAVEVRGQDADVLPLMEFIPACDPMMQAPTHLAPVVDAFTPIANGETIEFAFSVPPRHGKTTTLLYGIAWLMRQIQGLRVAYLTFSEDRALTVSREMQRIAKRAGVKPGSRSTFAEWDVEGGGVFRAASLLAGVVGDGFHVIVIDDPYRKRADADSLGIRTRTQESFEADVYTRQHMDGTSFIVLHTRWGTHDLIGTLTDPEYREGDPFRYINLPALNDDGSALAPWMYDEARLAKTRKTVLPYEWASQYMGHPVPKGSAVFDPPNLCNLADIPTLGRDAIGVDLGYTAKTSSDFSGYVVLRRCGEVYYVVKVERRQQRTPESQAMLKAAAVMYPGPMVWHCAGTELGAADLMIAGGVPLGSA